MAKQINATDLEIKNSELRKARALLIMLVDSEPDEEQAWRLGAVFDLVHNTMTQIDEMIDEAIKK